MEQGARENYVSLIKKGSNEWLESEKVTELLLKSLGGVLGAHRVYLFHLRGEVLSNTHEWVAQNIVSFQEKLSDLEAATSLPYFTRELRAGKVIKVDHINQLKVMGAQTQLEVDEMEREKIVRLMLVPVQNIEISVAEGENQRKGEGGELSALPSARTSGFIGIDVCGDGKEEEEKEGWWSKEAEEMLKVTGSFLFGIQTLCEIVTGQNLMLADHEPFQPSPASRRKIVAQVYTFLCQLTDPGSEELDISPPSCVDWLSDTPSASSSSPKLQCSLPIPSAAVTQVMQRVKGLAQNYLIPKTPPKSSRAELLSDAEENLPPSPALDEAALKFKKDRFAILNRATWLGAGIGEDELDAFHKLCQKAWSDMGPDIEPYTAYRDVGYSRKMYRYGALYDLKQKDFFQTKPEYNAVIGSQPRPFNRMPIEFRESAVLHKMLQVLLEKIWNYELGPEVHIGVHPVRVRNWTEVEGLVKLHSKAECTLEGTHVDSTQRVAVMLLERVNVHPSKGRTSLYQPECPFGLLRSKEEDEKILKEYRICEHILSTPFEAITFDDMRFKHDGDCLLAEKPSEKAWRSVMLVMARRPLSVPSPLDGRVIDGYSPRSPNRRRQAKEKENEK